MADSRILVVEDDPRVQHLLRQQLAARGYQVQVVDNAEEALDLVADDEPTVMLVDINLPGESGLELCRQVREWSSVPIILLTAIDTPETKIQGLQLGADDYVTKPFHTGELIARIQAAERRAAMVGKEAPRIITVDDLAIDLARHEVTRANQPVHLTRIEFNLLRELATHPDRVMTYEQLLSAVWGHGSTDSRTLHVHASNLRRKLGQGITGRQFIRSVPGIGYHFAPTD
jgi:two-component system KDP operon response regulator KdpE